MKVLFRISIALVMVWAFTGASVYASPSKPDIEPLVATDHVLQCQDFAANNEHVVAAWSSSPTASRKGVRAWFDYRIDRCTNITLDPSAGATVWVALMPRQPANNNQLVQLGVISCVSIPGDPGDCDEHSNSHFLVWAAGGCGIAVPSPRFIVNVPDEDIVGAKITLDSSNFVLTADLDADGGFDDITPILLPRNQSGLSCWDDVNLKAEVHYERKDRGDSAGIPLDATEITHMQYTTNGTSWSLIGLANLCSEIIVGGVHPVPCSPSMPTGTNKAKIWD